MGRIWRKLRREAKRHPKQVVVLALLTLVALWFWGPQLLRTVTGTGEATSTSSAGTSGTVAADTARTAPSGQADRTAVAHWDDLERWRKADPRHWPAAGYRLHCDPFQAVAGSVQTAESVPEQGDGVDASQPPVVAPADAGLAVSAIVWGRDQRLALIGGRALGEGDEIRRTENGHDTIFRLLHVGVDSVVMETGGQKFVVALPRGGTGSDIEIRRMQ